MSKNQIRIVIGGRPEDNGLVRVDGFIDALSTIRTTITRTDKLMSDRGDASFHLRIVELNYGSPATITWEEVLRDPQVDRRTVVNNRVASVYSSVCKETFAKTEVEYDLIEDMMRIGSLIGKKVGYIRFSVNGTDVDITREFKARVDLALAKDITHPGFIRGDLLYINLHGKSRVFKIYPAIGPSSVTCHFPDELKEAAKAAIERFVEVHGTLHYKEMSKFPYQIVAERLRILPRDEELPTFKDLFGIVSTIPDRMSSEEYVRDIRNAKDH
jgi:hypothetical protein